MNIILVLMSMSMLSAATAPDAGVAGSPVPAARPARGDAGVVALVERVQGFYERTGDFTADFTQTYTYAAFGRSQTSSGTVSFRKPAMMRWEYLKPSPKTFVLAGERAYTFDPAARLLTRTPVAQNQLSASVTFLWGKGKLLDEFTAAEAACASCTGTLLELTPRTADPRFKKVFLEVDARSGRVLASTVIDPDGSRNVIEFRNLATNVGVPESTFKLTPPPGTQVQDLVPPAR